MITSPDWHDRAECQGINVDFFTYRKDRRAALNALCDSCSVSAECLDFALFPLQTEGIWAGTDPNEREAMLRSDPALIQRGRDYAEAGIRQKPKLRRVRKPTR